MCSPKPDETDSWQTEIVRVRSNSSFDSGHLISRFRLSAATRPQAAEGPVTGRCASWLIRPISAPGIRPSGTSLDFSSLPGIARRVDASLARADQLAGNSLDDFSRMAARPY